MYILCICLSSIVLFLSPRISYCETRNIITFGDSLTEACYIEGNSACGWIGGNGYQNQLKSLLNNDLRTSVRDIKVFNYGKGGEQTHEGFARLTSLLTNYTCDNVTTYILIMEGTNDLLQYKDVGNIAFNIERIIAKSLEYGLQPLLATIPPDPDHTYKEIAALNEKIRAIAARMPEVILVDQYNALTPKWVEYTTPRGCYGDRTHPNNVGFEAMGTVWYESLSDLFPPPSLPWLNLLLRKP